MHRTGTNAPDRLDCLDAPLAHRLLASYHPRLSTLAAYLAEACDTTEAHILSLGHTKALHLLQTALVGSVASSKSDGNDAKGKGKAEARVESNLNMMQVITLAQGNLFASRNSKNLLVLGYRQTGDTADGGFDHCLAPYQSYAANTNVVQLGQCGGFAAILEHVGVDALATLLSNTSLYLPLPPVDHDCFVQVCGNPISSATPHAPLLPLTKRKREDTIGAGNKDESAGRRKTKAMPLPRLLMHHRRPERDKVGRVVIGLSENHILSNFGSLEPPPATPYHSAIHLAKYIFPTQFGLANIFTSPMTPRSGIKLMPEWEDRSAEIRKRGPLKTPQRLKGLCEEGGVLAKVVARAGKVNARKLLNRHCPSRLERGRPPSADRDTILSLMPPSDLAAQTGNPITQGARDDHSFDVSHASMIAPHGEAEAIEAERSKPHAFDYAVSPHAVESFAWAIVSAWGLAGWWGSPANEKVVRDHIRRIINLRRFETLTLHDLLQGFRIVDCTWLGPSSRGTDKQRTAQTGDLKRRELLQEWSWWFYMSFVVHVLRTTFYITESTAFRNRLLYFRQDDWYAICMPVLKNLREVHFEKISPDASKHGKLGHSYMRLVPKESGVRPVVNLRRKITQREGNTKSQAINKILQPVFAALNLEKDRDPELMGSSVLGPNETYLKLKQFKESLGDRRPKLYFVKVDIRACFDTIEQSKLLEVIERVLQEPSYTIQKYGTVSTSAGRIARKFPMKAAANDDDGNGPKTFADIASKLAAGLQSTIFCDEVRSYTLGRENFIELLTEHITQHRIKIGRSVYRQRVGIPQGSIVSTLLCSLFYADMEKTYLDCTKDPSSVLIRLIDDFLFITPSPELAVKFLTTMSAGHPDYGCYVSVEKSLVNFVVEMEVPVKSRGVESPTSEKILVPRVNSTSFPWCGYLIDTKTLDVRVDYERAEKIHIADGLTVDYTRQRGEVFRQKMLQAIKQRAHIIYTDTAHNSLYTVHLNIYQVATVTAMKFVAFLKASGDRFEKRAAFLHDVVQQCLQHLHVIIQNRAMTLTAVAGGAECAVRRNHTIWLGKHAFHRILSRRPTRFKPLIRLLSASLNDIGCEGLHRRFKNVVGARSNASLDKMRF